MKNAYALVALKKLGLFKRGDANVSWELADGI